MTVIVEGVKSKKELRSLLDALGANAPINFVDPAIIGAIHGGKRFTPNAMAFGEEFICTNHPRRSFFATVRRESATDFTVK